LGGWLPCGNRNPESAQDGGGVDWKHWFATSRLQGTKCCTTGLLGKEIVVDAPIMTVNALSSIAPCI
jgi:hypothetical protein